jgi:glycosyltransferase involved in cell wall biosynthesis
MSEDGIEVHFEPFAGNALAATLYQPGRLASKAAMMLVAWQAALVRARRAAAFDVVYLYREASLVGPALIERVIARRNPRIIYDFDDAIWQRYVSPSNRYFSYLKAPGKTRTLCRLAARVVVGNEHLAQFARRYNPSVTVVPSTVSLRRYRPAPPATPTAERVIGWTGSHSSIQYLRVAERALQRLAQRRRFRLRVIGVEGFSILGVDVQCLPWNAASEVEDLWPVDVGIMPLTEDEWTLGKCAMKAIQYLGVGIPAVVSPIGANQDVVQHGITGFHARNEDEWVLWLERCLDDDALRTRMGTAGRAAVEARFSAEAQVPRIAALVRSLAQ